MSSPQTPEESAGEYSIDDDDQLPQEDTLLDRGVDDLLDEGYSPPEKWQEPKEHETLDEQLADEEPDPAMQINLGDDEAAADESDDDDAANDYDIDDEVGDVRSGRLVAPNEGSGADLDSELFGSDVGIDGSAASAEEAAVHVIPDDQR